MRRTPSGRSSKPATSTVAADLPGTAPAQYLRTLVEVAPQAQLRYKSGMARVRVGAVLATVSALAAACGESQGEKYFREWTKVAPAVSSANATMTNPTFDPALPSSSAAADALARDYASARDRLNQLEPPEDVKDEQEALSRALSEAQGATSSPRMRREDAAKKVEDAAEAVDRVAADTPK